MLEIGMVKQMKHPRWLVLVVLVFSAVLAAAQQQPQAPSPSHESHDELVVDGKVVGKRVPHKPGDVCALCNQPTDPTDPTYLVHGQRVPLHAAEMKDPSAAGQLKGFLALLRPRGAFIGQSAPAELSLGWFIFGLYFLGGLLFAAMGAHRALHTGYSPISWFFVGLVFSALGYLYLLTRPKREVVAPAGIPPGLGKISLTYAPQACPKCGTENHPSAAQCNGCKASLSPQLTSEVARAGLRAN
jgi:hypothetical protein